MFLILPILIVLPLSFNVEPYFSFTTGMLNFDPEAFSMRWYEDILRNGMASPDAEFSWAWLSDTWNNGQDTSYSKQLFHWYLRDLAVNCPWHLAAIGLSRSEMPYRRLIASILISPMIVPLVITAAGMFYFYSRVH